MEGKLNINFLDDSDPKIYEDMERFVKVPFFQCCDLPIQTAFYGLRVTEGFDRSWGLKSIGDMII